MFLIEVGRYRNHCTLFITDTISVADNISLLGKRKLAITGPTAFPYILLQENLPSGEKNKQFLTFSERIVGIEGSGKKSSDKTH